MASSSRPRCPCLQQQRHHLQCKLAASWQSESRAFGPWRVMPRPFGAYSFTAQLLHAPPRQVPSGVQCPFPTLLQRKFHVPQVSEPFSCTATAAAAGSCAHVPLSLWKLKAEPRRLRQGQHSPLKEASLNQPERSYFVVVLWKSFFAGEQLRRKSQPTSAWSKKGFSLDSLKEEA